MTENGDDPELARTTLITSNGKKAFVTHVKHVTRPEQ
jgi:hypothetical protein